MNTIGLIGYGNMAQAIACGLVKQKAINPNNLYACAAHYDKLCDNAAKLGIHAMKCAEDVIAQSDLIILSVKPQKIKEVVTPIKMLLKDKVVLSIVAGYQFAQYEEILEEGTHHISTIPNTPVSVGQGIFICESKHSLTQTEFAQVKELLETISLVEVVEPSQFSIGGTMGGCTPAFTAMYIEALADAGVKHGLTRAAAYRIVAQMMVGTGSLYLASQTHPGAMKDAVCSPGGTTIKGVAALEKNGFRGALIDAIDAIED